MKRAIVLLAVFLALPLSVLAVEAGAPEQVALTIYNGDLALIREVRPVALAQGNQTVVLKDVSGQLRPDTVHLATPGLDVQLLEQNFDYDLVSREKLLQRFIGQTISLVDDATGRVITGTLLSVADGMVLMSDGQILLNPPGRVVLPGHAAAELLLRPTLSWLLHSPRAANVRAEVSYLSGGLNWEASYVLMLAADERSAGLEGWVTLSNYSGTTYPNAQLKLVAGDVNRVRDEMQKDMQWSRAAEAMPAPAPAFAQEQFFDYHLYNLQRTTTLRNNQQKQISLLSAAAVPTRKVYEFNAQGGNQVRVMVEFDNREEHGLGMPLPAGIVRVYKADSSGAPQFVGEDRIGHTPRLEELRLSVGNAFDIVGEATQVDYTDIGQGYEQTFRVELRNRKENEDVSVKVIANVGGDWEVLSADREWARKDANTIEFTVPIPRDSVAVLNYKVRVIWRK